MAGQWAIGPHDSMSPFLMDRNAFLIVGSSFISAPARGAEIDSRTWINSLMLYTSKLTNLSYKF